MIADLQWPQAFPADDLYRLDRLTLADADAIAAGADDEARRWLPLPDPYLRSDAETFLDRVEGDVRAGTRMTVGVRPVHEPTLLATASLQLDARPWEAAIGYNVFPHTRRRGVARRATLLLTTYAFRTLGLVRVEIVVQLDNLASRAVARSCGAVYEGVRRNGIRYVGSGDTFDAAVYSLVPDDLAI